MTNKPVKSPLQIKQNPLFLVKLGADLLNIHKTFLSKVDEFNKAATQVAEEASRIRNLPKGEKGDPGPKGEDGKDGANGENGKDASALDLETVAKVAASMIPVPQNGAPGKDAVIDYDELAKILSERLRLDERDKKISNEIASYRNQLAGKVYGKDTFVRGGGDTVKAGTNVTITTDAAGNKVINAQGGSAGATLTTQYQLTAVQVGDDVTIALSQLTHFATYQGLVQVQRNNVPQTETLNFTQTATSVTIFNADASEVFNIMYAYS